MINPLSTIAVGRRGSRSAFTLAFLVCAFCAIILITGCEDKKHRYSVSWTDTEEIEADADAWVYQADPDANYGDDIELYAGYTSAFEGEEENIFLHFDTSSIPSTATVVSAELWLYIALSWNTYGIEFSLEKVDDEWDEMGITWNSAPPTTYVTQFACPPDSYEGWFKITSPRLTALVQTWVSETASNYGLAIMPVWSELCDDEIYVTSLDGGTPPKLVVHYNP